MFPQYPVVFRIVEGRFASNAPGAMTMEIKIDAGYIGSSEEFTALKTIHHVMPADAIGSFFGGSVDAAKTLMENLSGAIGTYLLTNGVIEGEIIP